MPRYRLDSTWLMSGTEIVEADSLEEALEQAERHPLPEDAHYCAGSWEVVDSEELPPDAP